MTLMQRHDMVENGRAGRVVLPAQPRRMCDGKIAQAPASDHGYRDAKRQDRSPQVGLEARGFRAPGLLPRLVAA